MVISALALLMGKESVESHTPSRRVKRRIKKEKKGVKVIAAFGPNKNYYSTWRDREGGRRTEEEERKKEYRVSSLLLSPPACAYSVRSDLVGLLWVAD